MSVVELYGNLGARARLEKTFFPYLTTICSFPFFFFFFLFSDLPDSVCEKLYNSYGQLKQFVRSKQFGGCGVFVAELDPASFSSPTCLYAKRNVESRADALQAHADR